MARRPTQRTKMWLRDAIVLGNTKGQEMRALILPPLGPEPKRLSQRQSRDLIPKASIIRLGHPEKQRRPLLHQDTASPKQPTQRGSPSSKGRGEAHTVHKDLPQAGASPTAGPGFPAPTLAGESRCPLHRAAMPANPGLPRREAASCKPAGMVLTHVGAGLNPRGGGLVRAQPLSPASLKSRARK